MKPFAEPASRECDEVEAPRPIVDPQRQQLWERVALNSAIAELARSRMIGNATDTMDALVRIDHAIDKKWQSLPEPPHLVHRTVEEAKQLRYTAREVRYYQMNWQAPPWSGGSVPSGRFFIDRARCLHNIVQAIDAALALEDGQFSPWLGDAMCRFREEVAAEIRKTDQIVEEGAALMEKYADYASPEVTEKWILAYSRALENAGHTGQQTRATIIRCLLYIMGVDDRTTDAIRALIRRKP